MSCMSMIEESLSCLMKKKLSAMRLSTNRYGETYPKVMKLQGKPFICGLITF